jgi:hypothetical protein
MRNISLISAVAAAGLLSQGALALPTPVSRISIARGVSDALQRIIYPYPVYTSDEVGAFTVPSSDSQTRLEIISAAFSKAIDVGFATVVLRPHEHLVSFLRYCNPKTRVVLSHTVSVIHKPKPSFQLLIID